MSDENNNTPLTPEKRAEIEAHVFWMNSYRDAGPDGEELSGDDACMTHEALLAMGGHTTTLLAEIDRLKARIAELETPDMVAIAGEEDEYFDDKTPVQLADERYPALRRGWPTRIKCMRSLPDRYFKAGDHGEAVQITKTEYDAILEARKNG